MAQPGVALGEPFAEPLFGFKACRWSRLLQPTPHLLDHVKVILDVFERTVIGQFVQQRLNLLLSSHKFMLASRITLPTLSVPLCLCDEPALPLHPSRQRVNLITVTKQLKN